MKRTIADKQKYKVRVENYTVITLTVRITVNTAVFTVVFTPGNMAGFTGVFLGRNW